MNIKDRLYDRKFAVFVRILPPFNRYKKRCKVAADGHLLTYRVPHSRYVGGQKIDRLVTMRSRVGVDGSWY